MAVRGPPFNAVGRVGTSRVCLGRTELKVRRYGGVGINDILMASDEVMDVPTVPAGGSDEPLLGRFVFVNESVAPALDHLSLPAELPDDEPRKTLSWPQKVLQGVGALMAISMALVLHHWQDAVDRVGPPNVSIDLTLRSARQMAPVPVQSNSAPLVRSGPELANEALSQPRRSTPAPRKAVRLPVQPVLVEGAPSSIRASQSEALRAWRPSVVDPQDTYTGSGAVFDPRFARSLNLAAPARSTAIDARAELPNLHGEQQVIVGDRCFTVTKLDDQAMRGMASWTRGLCQSPSAKANKITLGKLP